MQCKQLQQQPAAASAAALQQTDYADGNSSDLEFSATLACAAMIGAAAAAALRRLRMLDIWWAALCVQLASALQAAWH
jgi:hypothetical protein